MMQQPEVLYAWSFEDTKNRSPLWYIIALACTIGLIIWGFLTGQYGMSVVVMLIAGFFYFLENNAEDQVSVSISELGILVQNNFYDYARIGAYNFVYDGNQAIYLRLHIKKRGISYMNLRVDTPTATHIRPLLSNYIEESAKQNITLLEKITHILKL